MKAPTADLLFESIFQSVEAIIHQDLGGICEQLHVTGQLEELSEIEVELLLAKGDRQLLIRKLRVSAVGDAPLTIETFSDRMGWLPLCFLQCGGWQVDPIHAACESSMRALETVAHRLEARLLALREWWTRKRRPAPGFALVVH